MNKILKSYPATLVSLLAGGLLFAVSIIFNLDFFELFVQSLHNMEHFEIDEIIIPLFITLIGVSIDVYKISIDKRNAAQLSEAKLESLQTTMRTVQDIVGNSMNNLILYTMEAKETGTLSEQSINDLENLINNTAKKIDRLASIKEIRERKLEDKIYVIDVDDQD